MCRGAVQGVGFRPTVHRLARELDLGGSVRNDPEGAVVEIEGPSDAVEEFLRRFPSSMPPLARLEEMEIEELPVAGATAFSVDVSRTGRRAGAMVPPDAALCADCRREMADPQDRRHRYAFTTCTNCGPRFSLVLEFPYDRARTSMACFPLCEACAGEYTDPENRRFHAEPVCCPSCGPVLRFVDGRNRDLADANGAIRAAREALAEGRLVAVKGLGGFQIACRADRPEAVRRLRDLKNRPTKPFAVMVRNLAGARRLVRLGAEDERLLSSPRGPIVLAPRVRPSPVADDIAPGIDDLGVMLPTTPLHVELLSDERCETLVMTSGNAGDEPIARGNREALARLSGVADLFLVHDRDVVRRVDDSVVRTCHRGHVMVRRSRGFVPEPLPLPERTPGAVLGLGGHLQVTACVGAAGLAFPSQHVGDLDTEPAREFLLEVVEGLESFLDARAAVVVVDSHPDYPGTWMGEQLAARRALPLMRVQHHLAHAASVLGEHRAFPGRGHEAGAMIFDGTGWGPDGTSWGGEWILLDGDLRWRRVASLQPMPLVGGERAVREPWRVAAAVLAASGMEHELPRLPLAALVEPERLLEVAELSRHPGWPLATGAGRLFEAAGALLGLTASNTWEGEAAARFEATAEASGEEPEPWRDVPPGRAPSERVLPGFDLLAALARRVLSGENHARAAAAFHATFCHHAVEIARRVLPAGATVALGGGCMVNRILLRRLAAGLEEAGFEALVPAELPPGDGGLAYGQTVLASVALVRGKTPELKGDL